MDHIDIELLHLLVDDADVTSTHLATKLNLSIPAINKRVAKLKRIGVIKKTTILTDPVKIGKPLTVYIFLGMEARAKTSELLSLLLADSDVLECNAVTGEYDYIVKVCTADIAALERKLAHMKERGVCKSNTLVCLQELKLSPAPLPSLRLR